MKPAKSLNTVYRSLLSTIWNKGITEVNSRTGVTILVLPGGYSFKLIPSGYLPVPSNRRYSPHIAAAETAWQFMGTQDPKFILEHAPKLWTKFVEEGKIKTAYGWRWRKAFHRDQIKLMLDELQHNPSNRQLFILAWDPFTDGLGGEQPKNVPCPVGFSIHRINNSLHMSVFIRSSDVFVGLPYDIMSYSLTLDAIAASIDCKPGSLHITLAHAHIYEPQWRFTDACLNGPPDNDEDVRRASKIWPESCQPTLPAWPINRILSHPKEYCDTVKTLSNRTTRNSWNPDINVVQ